MTNIEKLESNFLTNNTPRSTKHETNIFYSNELSQELLVNYLCRTNTANEDKIFGNDNISDLFSNAVSTNENYMISRDINGFSVIGWMNHYDHDTNTIFLPVVLSTNRILEIKSQGKDNKYAVDLAVLRYLYGKPANLAVIAVDRLFTNYKTMQTKMLNFIDVTDTYSDDEIEQMLIQRTTELDTAIKSKKHPGICSNLRWHKRQGKSINMSCTHYCSYNHVCPHAKKNSKARISKNSIIF